MMPTRDPENQKVGEDKFAKLWARRIERLEKVFRQRFCYSTFIFVVVLYTVLFKSDISFVELVIAFNFSMLTSYFNCTLEGNE